MKKSWILLVVFTAMFALSFTAQDAVAVGSVMGQVVDADNNPVEGAQVMIQQLVRGERRFEARTETNGRGVFEFPRVPAGNFIVAACAEDLGRARDRIEVVDDEVTRLRLQLEGRQGGDREREVGAIVGHVQTPNGDPIAGAMVTLWPIERQRGRQQRGLRTQSDREGNFVMLNVPAGRYVISAIIRGGVARQRIEVVANQRNPVRLVLQRPERRGGRGEGGDRDYRRE